MDKWNDPVSYDKDIDTLYELDIDRTLMILEFTHTQ